MVDPYEFYVTPEWVTETLLRFVPFGGAITEPCCGSGAISRVLLRHGHEVESFDLVDRGYGRVQNFLTWPRFCDNVATNPPFKNGANIISQALMLSRRKTAMLLPVRSLALKRNRPLFRRGLRMVLYLPYRPKFLAGGKLSYTCPYDTAWFVWERGWRGRTEIAWL
jgi:hypothetical protein